MAQDLVKLTVNLTLRSAAALEDLAEMLGVNKTDALNRAVQVAQHVTQVDRAGGRLYTRDAGSNELAQLRFL